MKKTTLALMMIGVGVVSASSQAAEVYNKNGNKLDLYGKVKAMHYMSEDRANNDGDKTYARFGFKGETQVNDQLTGFGRWEAEFGGSIDEGNSSTPAMKTRLAFAGLKAKTYGSIDYGRNLGILYDAASVTDMLPEFGGDSLTRTDNFMTKRTTGVATYRNTDFFGVVDGLNLGLQYQGKNESSSRSASKQNGDGYGTSLSYNFGGSPFTIVGAYAKSDRTNLQNKQTFGKGDNAEAWVAGVKYDANNIYLAAMYGIAQNMTPITNKGFANTTENFEAVAQYQFDFGLRPSIAYVQTKGKDLENGWGDQDLVKYVDVGATYYFNKNFSAMVDYKINQLDKSDFSKYLGSSFSIDDVVAVGVTYQF